MPCHNTASSLFQRLNSDPSYECSDMKNLLTNSITCHVNGEETTRLVEGRELAVHFIRDQLGLTGTHIGCDTSQCGACTVLVDGLATKSCTLLAAGLDSRSVTTIEGYSMKGAQLTELQSAFKQFHALQCGFCTPGILLAMEAFLAKTKNPTEAQIREALHGNLCRCTGYQNIIDAVLHVVANTSNHSTSLGGLK